MRSMFTSEMTECHNKTVTIYDVDESAADAAGVIVLCDEIDVHVRDDRMSQQDRHYLRH